MLVRYRTNSSCTIENFKTDINNIITGNVTTVNDLSSGADKVNSIIYGTYPAAIYTRVNASTFTYSKVHNDVSTSKTHYFRLTFDSTKLTTLQLAQSYTSGSDTLVNGYTTTLNMNIPAKYDSFYKSTTDIIVSNKLIAICSPASGGMNIISDIGHSSTTRTFTNSMLMAYTSFSTNPFLSANTVNPYMYNYDTPGYSTNTNLFEALKGVRKAVGSTSVVFENPCFILSTGASNLVYGLYRVPDNCFSGVQTYKDASNLYRLTFNNLSLLVD